MVENASFQGNLCQRICCCCCFRQRGKMPRKLFNTSNTLRQPSLKREPTEYRGPLPDELEKGQVITIRGETDSHCYRFSFALKCSREDNADIGLFFSPMLMEKYVERNSRIDGVWGQSERSSCRRFPFELGKRFKIVIFHTANGYLLAVNGKHFCSFAYRIPLAKMKIIEVFGRVYDVKVTYRSADLYPEQGDEHSLPLQLNSAVNCDKMSVPFTGKFYNTLRPGLQLSIEGRVKLLPHSFYINLQTANCIWPHPDIHLHLNPRFCTKMKENTFVRNAWIGGWGQEEIAPAFPFVPGSEFEMKIKFEEQVFSIWVNGMLTAEFMYRASLEAINTLYIQGDIYLTKVLLK